MYAIPTMNSLYDGLHQNVGFLGLSTAFEDFEYNTAENTKDLLADGAVYGETLKLVHKLGMKSYDQKLKFPVAFDYLLTDDEKESRLSAVPAQLRTHMMRLDQVAHTFWFNDFRGTPTFVIFDQDYQILHESMGHVDAFRLKEMIEYFGNASIDN